MTDAPAGRLATSACSGTTRMRHSVSDENDRPRSEPDRSDGRHIGAMRISRLLPPLALCVALAAGCGSTKASVSATSSRRRAASSDLPTVHGAGTAMASTSSTIDFGIMADYLGPIARDYSDPNTGISLGVPPADAKATIAWRQAVAQCFSGAGICNTTGGTIRVSLAIGSNPQSGEVLADGSIDPTMHQNLVYVLAQTLSSCAPVGGASGTNTPPSTYPSCTALSFIDAHTGRGVSAVSGPSITDPLIGLSRDPRLR